MKMIWKFKLGPDTTNLTMPVGAVVLSTAVQFGEVCIWVEVDTLASYEQRSFLVIGTGFSLENEGFNDFEQLTPIGTVLMDDGSLIWHVYEIKERGSC